MRHYDLRTEGRGQIYLPYSTQVWGLSLVVRSAGGDPVDLVPGMRAALAELDPDVPLTQIRHLEALFDATVARERLTLGILAGFGVLALALALLGLYAVISHTVLLRTREIGIRMALGQPRGGIVRGLLEEGIALALLGTGAGLAASLLAARTLEGLLFEVEPADPVTLGLVAGLLVTVSAIATLLPARRVTAIDPAAALRGD